MKEFEITRIDTKFGAFKVAGQWGDKNDEANMLKISFLAIMSTDGWSELGLLSDSTLELINQIQSQLIEHLTSTNKL
jgi:hypothetical protein